MSTRRSTFASQMNGLKNDLDRLAVDLRAEYDGLPALLTLAGEDVEQQNEIKARRRDLREANTFHQRAAAAWSEARTAHNKRNSAEAERLYKTALDLYDDAMRIFQPDTVTPTPSNTSDDTPPVGTSEPVKKEDKPAITDPKPEENKTDDSLKPVQDDKSKDEAKGDEPAPSWVADLQATVQTALETNADTIRTHVEGCNNTLEEFRKALEELQAGTLRPELATILNTYNEDELRAILAGAQDAALLAQRLDLDWLAQLQTALNQKGLTVDDLVAAVELGNAKRKLVQKLDQRRWGARKDPNAPSQHGTHA